MIRDKAWCDNGRVLLDVAEKKGLIGKPVDSEGKTIEWKDVSDEDLVKGVPYLVKYFEGLKSKITKGK